MEFVGVKKILVIKLRHIGDVLLTVPVFRALHETFPEARISALVNSGTADVLSGNPLIRDVLTVDRSIKEKSLAARYFLEAAFLRDIRSRAFDMTVDLTGGDRAALLSYVSGARYRIGWKSSKGFIGKGLLYTQRSRPDIHTHMVLQNLDVVRPFGITTGDLSVDFQISGQERDFIEELLRQRGIPEETTVVHVHPTSRWLFKCWRDEAMAEIMDWILDRGATVIVTSSGDNREKEKVRKILSLIPEGSKRSMLVDLSGKTTLKQLGSIARRASLFFGVDTAPMHIAAAMGTPVVALFGPSGAFNWGPWDKSDPRGYRKKSGIQRTADHIVLQRDWDCVPCGRDGCGGTKKSRCLESIDTEEVKAAILEKLEPAMKTRMLAAGKGPDDPH